MHLGTSGVASPGSSGRLSRFVRESPSYQQQQCGAAGPDRASAALAAGRNSRFSLEGASDFSLGQAMGPCLLDMPADGFSPAATLAACFAQGQVKHVRSTSWLIPTGLATVPDGQQLHVAGTGIQQRCSKGSRLRPRPRAASDGQQTLPRLPPGRSHVEGAMARHNRQNSEPESRPGPPALLSESSASEHSQQSQAGQKAPAGCDSGPTALPPAGELAGLVCRPPLPPPQQSSSRGGLRSLLCCFTM